MKNALFLQMIYPGMQGQCLELTGWNLIKGESPVTGHGGGYYEIRAAHPMIHLIADLPRRLSIEGESPLVLKGNWHIGS